MVGIIDNKYVDKNIKDFTNSDVFGYGLATANKTLYHVDETHEFRYLRGDSFSNDITVLIMELDLTGNQSNNDTSNETQQGQLSLSIEGKINNEYDNIAFNNVDLDRSYRLTVALYNEDEAFIVDAD